MDVIKIDINNVSPEDVENIAAAFKEGKIVAYPTDTIYGLGCLATDKKAVARVFKIKKRSRVKALLILVKSWCMLKKYFYISGKKEKYLRGIWPGPVSVLLPKRSLLPDDLAPGKDKIAVRLPKNDFLIKIINKVGAPIVSTSLNIAGKPPIEEVSGLGRRFKGDKPDLVVDIGRKLKGKPSKLVDIENIEDIRILRK